MLFLKNYLIIIVLLSFFSYSQSGKITEKEMDYLYKQYELNIYSPQKVKLYAEKYLKNGKILKDDYHIINGYGMILTSSSFDIGLKYLDSMMKISKGFHKSMVTFTYYRKGQFYCKHRKLKLALQNYLLAYKNIESEDDFYLSYIKYEIAVVKVIMGKHEEALATFHEMEKQLSPKKDIDVIFALSNTYFNMNNLEKAIKYTSQGLNLTEKLNRKDFYQFFVSNRGKIFYKSYQFDKAIKDLQVSLKTIKNTGDFANFAENCYYLGESYRKSYNREKALLYFNKIDSVFNKDKYIFPVIINSYKHLISDAKNSKNIDKTLYYTNQLLKADSLIKQNYDYIIDTTHKEYDLPELIADKEVMIKELKNSSRNSIIIFSLIVFLSSISFWFYHKKKKNELIEQKKLFNQYLIDNDLRVVLNENEKVIEKTNSIDIDEEIIDEILEKLSLFENNLGFKKEITLDSLAKEFDTNTSYLSMIINKKKGFSFPAYINNLRIEHTIELLQRNKKYMNYSIKGLAFEVGFSSVQTFSRAFLAKTGVNASFFINELKDKHL